MLICPLCERVYPGGSYDRCPEDGSPLYVVGDDVAARKVLGPGDLVAGKYELIQEIVHRTGAGRTFRARQVQLQRDVELRLLPENTIVKPADHARFRREVETWGRLRSDHLVRLYDSGFAEGNAPYMALEYIDGGSARERLTESGKLTVELVEACARHVLKALKTAHEANVLHRDITPDAIIMSRRADGSVSCRLTGFGLAKHLGDDDDDPTAITMTGQVVGSPAYMAPETIMRGILDPRTDLYALGVTLYELLAAERPFPGTSLADLLAAHIRGVPVPIAQYRSDVPTRFRIFLEHMIAREPERRFQTADQALQSLEYSDQGTDLAPSYDLSLRREEAKRREFFLMFLMFIATMTALTLLALL
ncbi:MAG: serine/threonine-protein kinase [Bradymonadia bacterium]